MPRRAQRSEELSTRLAEIAGWQTARRDDAKVALELHSTREIDRVFALNEAAFFDELFHYIREIGAWPLLEQLDPDKREGAIYPFIQFVMLTLMRCVGGVQSMLAMHDLVLTDEALMSTVGFNAAQGLFPKHIDAVLDATDNEATPSYQTDDGREVPRVRREKRPDVRANRHAKKVEVTVFGWKVWVVWEATSRIPLAICLDDINVADNPRALSVLRQAAANVAGRSTIRSVALDRGFLDGKLLSAIERVGILVYIPAKANLNIAKDAREIARRAAEQAARGRKLEGCVYRERQQTVTHGAGKNATRAELTTSLVGIRDLPCDWWGEEGCTSKANSKHFVPKLLRATVVLRWDGAPKEAEREVVFLTTDPAEDPFVAFDAYDDRSLIENSCNREAKEHWFLEHHPKRSEAGVRVHTYFVFLGMALVAGFRQYKAKADEAERRGQDTGIARYRRQLEMTTRDKVAVFIGDDFGILRTWEMLLLVGIPVRERVVMGESTETVLCRYGANQRLPDSS